MKICKTKHQVYIPYHLSMEFSPYSKFQPISLRSLSCHKSFAEGLDNIPKHKTSTVSLAFTFRVTVWEAAGALMFCHFLMQTLEVHGHDAAQAEEDKSQLLQASWQQFKQLQSSTTKGVSSFILLNAKVYQELVIWLDYQESCFYINIRQR